MSLDVLKKQLASGQLARLYLLYGDEGWLKTHYCGRIAKAAVDGMESFNFHRFDGEVDLGRLTAALDNLPMMSRRKCIVLRDVDPDTFKADQWKEFQTICRDIPEDAVVVLHYDAVAYSKKSSRWRTLISLAGKTGLAVEIGRQSAAALSRWLQKGAETQGCFLSPENAEYIVECCGDDMNTLTRELDKFCARVGSGEIRRGIIDALAVRSVETSVYDLARSVTAGNLERALAVIAELYAQKADPIFLLSTLSGAVCDLFRARAARLSGARERDIMEAFHVPPNRGFTVRNAMRDAADIPIAVLRENLSLLLAADQRLKSSGGDGRVVLERLVVEMTQAGKAGRRA